MVPVALSDVIAVGEVPTAAEIEILANAGFRSLLNTQPDGEVERLMPSADAQRLAEKSGLAYRHVPIESRRPDQTSLDAFAAALGTLPRPIYACCYSGARSATAWALAVARAQQPDAVIAACTVAGYDIGFLKPRLMEVYADAAVPSTGVPSTVTNDHVATGGVSDGAPVVDERPAPAPKPITHFPRAASDGGYAVAG